MSTLRVFEIAREYGIDSKELITRMSRIGIVANDHLTALDQDSVAAIRKMLATAPSGDVIEKRISRTVRKRRRARPKAADGAGPVIAAAPEPVEAPVITMEAPAAPKPVSIAPEPAEHPEPAGQEEPAAPAPTPELARKPEAPAPVPVPVAVTESAPVPEPVSENAPQPVVAAAEPSLRAVELPPLPSNPTMERAVVTAPNVNRTVLANVQKTRAEKGYDLPAGAPSQDGPRGPKQPGDDRRPGAPRDGVVRPGDRRNDKKKGPGRRLAYDKRRDHLIRRGMLDHDDIFRGGRAKKKRPNKRQRTGVSTTVEMKESKRVVKMGAGISLGDLAQGMMVRSTQVIGKLMQLGIMATVNQTIDFDTATMIAEEFGWRVESHAFDLSDYIEEVGEETTEDVEPRPPVVTVMGHVDHGKTSLLDCIRNARVAEGEAGGITQHIGAYTVALPDKGEVVFIDTPGHEAFTAMRARGSQATDLVILVVAADDGVMPQTIESINHARAAEVPIVVAVNKIDKSNANPDKVLSELSEQGLVSEDWGGETVVCHVSALKNEGIENLLEMVLLQAELLELGASTKVPASGIVLEGRLEKGRGPVATLLVQEGILEVGDVVVSGTVSGKVRALTDDKGKKIKQAGPSTPVEVIGLSGVPDASDTFHQVKDDRAAKKILDHRVDEARSAAQIKAAPRKMSLDSLSDMLAQGEVQELNIIVKADVHGSAEALKQALEKQSHPEVTVRVIHAAVGGINESDVNLASASSAIIIGFGVRPESKAKDLAEQTNVEIKLYSIIYDALDEVKLAMAGLLAPVEQEKTLGAAEVRATFTVPKHGTIAGCAVTDGIVNRGSKVRLVRDSKTIYTGSVTSLRRFKDDVREVKAGYECGIGIGYNDIKEGDVLEFFEIEQVAATLD